MPLQSLNRLMLGNSELSALNRMYEAWQRAQWLTSVRSTA